MSFDRAIYTAFEIETTDPEDPMEPIAIVGVGCKFPGDISSLGNLFEALRAGKNCITEVSPDRWNVDEYLPSGPTHTGQDIRSPRRIPPMDIQRINHRYTYSLRFRS
jgi:hypothetical protein